MERDKQKLIEGEEDKERRKSKREKETNRERGRAGRVWAARIRFPHSSYRHT